MGIDVHGQGTFVSPAHRATPVAVPDPGTVDGENGGTAFRGGALRSREIPGDRSAEAVDLRVEDLQRLRRSGVARQRRPCRHLGELLLLPGPESLEVIRHRQGRLDLAGSNAGPTQCGDRCRLGCLAEAGAAKQEAGLGELSARLGFAADELGRAVFIGW